MTPGMRFARRQRAKLFAMLRDGDAPATTAPAQPDVTPQADQPEHIEVASYRTDAGRTAWAMRCWGAGACDGLVSLDHDTERWAVVVRDRHLAEAHNATATADPVPQPEPDDLRALCPGHESCDRCDVTDPCPCCGLTYINGRWVKPPVAQHRFTVAPHDPEAERAATERVRQAAADSEKDDALFRKATGGGADGPLVLDRAAATAMRDCLNQLLDDEPADDGALRERYAAAIRSKLAAVPRFERSPWTGEIAHYGGVTEHDLADAVLAVRDDEVARLRAELEAQRATPRELELRQRRERVAAGRCPMCGRADTDGRLCGDCASTVRALPSHNRRQWRRYEPRNANPPIQGPGYTPADLLGMDLDDSPQEH